MGWEWRSGQGSGFEQKLNLSSSLSEVETWWKPRFTRGCPGRVVLGEDLPFCWTVRKARLQQNTSPSDAFGAMGGPRLHLSNPGGGEIVYLALYLFIHIGNVKGMLYKGAVQINAFWHKSSILTLLLDKRLKITWTLPSHPTNICFLFISIIIRIISQCHELSFEKTHKSSSEYNWFFSQDSQYLHMGEWWPFSAPNPSYESTATKNIKLNI